MYKKGLFFLSILMLLVLSFSSLAEEFPIYFKSNPEINIDGNLDDWPFTVPCVLASDTQITEGERKSFEDFNGIIKSFFDSNNIYISGIIEDSTPLLNNFAGNEIYQGDCLEAYIGFHDEKHREYENDYQFGISLTSDEVETWHWTKGKELEGYNVEILQTDNGYQFEAKIPLTNFDVESVKPGQKVWFDFGLDNGEGKDTRAVQLVAFGDGSGWQTPEVWKKAYITDNKEVFAKPYIITPPAFETKKYHRIYVWYQGEFLNNLDDFEEKFEDDSRPGYGFSPVREGVVKVSDKVDNYQIDKAFNVEKTQEFSKITMPVRDIKVNQVGYLTDENKYFILTDNEDKLTERKFTIITPLMNEEVYKGELIGPIKDPTTGDVLYYGGFNDLEKPGMYKIQVAGFDDSYVFTIDNNKYSNLFYKTMRSYYLQRCGIEIKDDISDVSHEACHIDDGYLKTSPDIYKDVTGGWHDAGDYGKYIPPAGVTVAQLSLMYQFAGNNLSEINLDIPESANDTADVLDELKYELDWMLKMQDEDGGVYHKVTPPNFSGIVTPDNDNKKRLIYEKGTADTAIFAGAVALAADVFADIDSSYAERLEEAAVNAGEFLQQQNQILWPSNDNTGAYKTSTVSDEEFWCYAQLYNLTGQDKYQELASDYVDTVKNIEPISWDDTSALAVYALLDSNNLSENLRSKLLDRMKKHADKVVSSTNNNGYPVALEKSDYYWASNKVTLAYGLNLVLANQFIPDSNYIDAARKQLDYVLGMNALSKSYLTDIGTDRVRYPHHRIIMATDEIVPGLLVGGPNNNAEDGLYDKNMNQKGYIDDQDAYSCNEYAIDYNAPFVFLTAYFMSNQ
ncbi:MAG: glycoside hydrolase family 9 protein [Halothermotrichaceae bacterium]